MSCSNEAILRQVQRLSGLDFFPRGDAKLELLRALSRTAEDDADAKRIIDTWLDESAIAPKPAEILALRKQPDWDEEQEPLTPPPLPSQHGFVKRGNEYLDPNWQAVCVELGWPTNSEFYDAFWHDPNFSIDYAARQLLAWPFLLESDKTAVRAHLDCGGG